MQNSFPLTLIHPSSPNFYSWENNTYLLDGIYIFWMDLTFRKVKDKFVLQNVLKMELWRLHVLLPVLPSTITCREEIPPLTVVTTTEQKLPDLREWKLYLLVSLETLSFLMTTFSWMSKTWQNSMSPSAGVQVVNRLLVVPWLATCKPVTWAGTKTQQTERRKKR